MGGERFQGRSLRMDTNELTRIIRPQRQIDLIVSVDFIREKIDVRATVIFDVNETQKRITIAQTSPPILKSMIGREVEATMLIKQEQGEGRKRVGFQAKILDYLPQYSLRKGVIDQALAIGYPEKPVKETSVRLHYRVHPSKSHGISVSINNESGQVNLLDLSLGGLLISYGGGLEFRQGQRLSLVLTINKTAIPLAGEAIRLFDREGSKLLFVGIKFTEIETKAARVIQETVSLIMREDLKSRSGLGGRGS